MFAIVLSIFLFGATSELLMLAGLFQPPQLSLKRGNDKKKHCSSDGVSNVSNLADSSFAETCDGKAG